MSQDPYRYFRVEANEIREQLGRGALQLEEGAPPPDLVARLLRAAHTLKGAARVVKQPQIAELAHAAEDALAPFREGAAAVPRERVDALLHITDAIGALLGALTPPPGRADPGAPAAAAAAGRSGDAEEPLRVVRAEAGELDALMDGLAETHVLLGRLRRDVASAGRARRLADLVAEQLPPARARDAGGAAPARLRAVGEELRRVAADLEASLGGAVSQLGRELGQVRDAAERLRLLPAGALFAPLERAARDAAQAVGRQVAFQAGGADVRLDARVLGVVQGALVQLVRNAVAHGIEAPAERVAARKSAAGLVRLDVARRGSRVAFRCRDDGAGVDLEAVRRAASARGLAPDEALRLGTDDLLALLLKGGLSTSVAVTEMAGRGVGLDVVREAAARLGGQVTMQTESARGTTVELVVPVSLASLGALVVEAGGVAAAIPLDAVRAAVRLSARDVTRAAQGDCIVHEGKVIPFVPLARPLGGAPRAVRDGRPWSAVVVDGGQALAAVGVDRLLGAATVILRPLPALALADPIVAGASLDAEGNPQIVLDPHELVSRAARGEGAQEAAAASRPPAVLVVDDSLTTRMLEQSILESAGYEVELATSGEEGLQKARTRPFGLFLVDVEMPGMDGFAFLERARADAALSAVPAILVTSRDAPEDRRRGLQAGARAYVVKSEFDQSALLDTIRRLLE
jgi:two-component system chemotaxis sensor kinase CheA